MNPSLYQINTKAVLHEIGPLATLDDVPDALLDEIAQRGFDWVWFLGVWKLGPTARTISRTNTQWHHEYQQALPDLTTDDICGSPFAVCGYEVSPEFGGDVALARLRKRLASRKLKLLLDFVPNHIGLDHPWLTSHPDFVMTGTEDDLRSHPSDWCRLPDGRVVAHGRDPYFPGWVDTVQLNYYNPALRLAMVAELKRLAQMCDGVRCDMAMLLEPEVFQRTWAGRSGPFAGDLVSFWPGAIDATRSVNPTFVFMAEVYWHYEYKLQQHGFDFTYDKTLYDRLVESSAKAVQDHLAAPLSYQQKMVRFLENHDEPRIASRVSFDHHRAMALVTLLSPGMRFIHHGQREGKRVKIPVHLRRAQTETRDEAVWQLYEKLLLIVNSHLGKNGTWCLLYPLPAWDGNDSYGNFVAYTLQDTSQLLIIAANLAPYRSQCRLRLPVVQVREDRYVLVDLLTGISYERSVYESTHDGLYIECDGYGGHLFSVTLS